MRVGVISDTHGLLRPEAVEALHGVEHILHAGDIGPWDILEQLRDIAPTTVVRGNVDYAAWARELPLHEWVELAGRTLYMVHRPEDIDIDPVAAGIDVVIHGHTHLPRNEWIDGVLYLNPGSAGPRRAGKPVTLAILTLGPTIEARRTDLE